MVKKGYKQTEVGVIPEDWDIKHLDDFGTIVGGGTPSTSVKEYWEGNIAWCTPSDITSTNGNYISKTERNITLKGIKYSAATMLPPRSILLCTRATIGELKISTIQMATNQGFKNVILNKSGSVEYLYYLLQTKISDMKELAIGSTFLEISKKSLCSILLQSPPLCEQQCIAKALSDMDSMISLLEKLIAKYKSIKAACLQQMFPQNGETVPRMRLPGFTDAWEQCELGELALFNPKDELPQTFEYVDLESVVGTEMLSHRTEAKSSAPSRAQRLAHTGDLFYQTVRPYQRNNYLFEKPDNNYVFSTGYAQMRPYVDGYFLLSLVQSDRFVKVVLDNCTGTSYPAINANDLAEIEVTAPLDENEAQKIGTIFRSIDNLITLYQRKLEKVQKIKQGMMQQLLTGKIRLV